MAGLLERLQQWMPHKSSSKTRVESWQAASAAAAARDPDPPAGALRPRARQPAAAPESVDLQLPSGFYRLKSLPECPEVGARRRERGSWEPPCRQPPAS